eukprot:CAMPEP_0177652804 /NCGR_PEP_ID=MMETSP0447-20121125/13344_1 /TAXON_ID=0 /ORGANISM="Stygamoeba regulata, Strain BSH-02190019" /LENGTH=350 /DNA_ID=CAMNT_0019156111 /DNA_START=14 /DNA_END=1066 /DNA_ORIENTATION=+
MGNTVNRMVNMEGSARDNGLLRESTPDDVMSWTKSHGGSFLSAGDTVIVTGCNAGIGRVAVRALAQHTQAHIVMACRNAQKARAAARDIRKTVPDANLQFMELDLASLHSVEKFVREFAALGVPLKCVVCNAGVMGLPYSETGDGFQTIFAVNHLAHHYLVTMLKPQLQMASSARVVCVASSAHRWTNDTKNGVSFDDVSGKGTWYTGMRGPHFAYGQSKAANILFARELNRQWREEGLSVSALSLHPGAIWDTDLWRNFNVLEGAVMGIAGALLFKTVEQGASTTVFCCAAQGLEAYGGGYFSDCNRAQPAPHCADDYNARRLWEVSEDMIRQWKSRQQPRPQSQPHRL